MWNSKPVLRAYNGVLLVELKHIVPDFDHPTKAKDGTDIPGAKNEIVRVFVECADAVGGDAKSGSDQVLAGLGFPVLRFTSEAIFSDPIASALEVFWYLERGDHSSG